MSVIFLLLIKIIDLLMVLLVIRILMSWVAPHANWYKQPFKLLYALTEPVMAPFRALIQPIGGLDLSPMLLFFLLSLLEQVLYFMARF